MKRHDCGARCWRVSSEPVRFGSSVWIETFACGATRVWRFEGHFHDKA